MHRKVVTLGEIVVEVMATLVSQSLPRLWDDVHGGRGRPVARDLVIASMRAALAPDSAAYAAAPQVGARRRDGEMA